MEKVNPRHSRESQEQTVVITERNAAIADTRIRRHVAATCMKHETYVTLRAFFKSSELTPRSGLVPVHIYRALIDFALDKDAYMGPQN